MTTQDITLTLPELVYEQIRRAAIKANRSVDDVLVEAVMAAAPASVTADDPLRLSLAQIAYLNDAALWQMARSIMSLEQRDRMESLHDKQQREGLTVEEREEDQKLLALYRETILVRAQAAAVLKQRGYDISDPQQVAPLV